MIETQGILSFILVVMMLATVVALTIREIGGEERRHRRQLEEEREELADLAGWYWEEKAEAGRQDLAEPESLEGDWNWPAKEPGYIPLDWSRHNG